MIDELEVVRRIGAGEGAPDPQARERVRARVLAGRPAPRARRTRRTRRTRRWALPSLPLLAPAAAVALAAVLLVVLRPGGDGREFTGQRAPGAQAAPSLVPRPSEFLYVRTRGRSVACSAPGRCGLGPERVREVWISERRRGRIAVRGGGDPPRTTEIGPVVPRLGGRSGSAELERYRPTPAGLLRDVRAARGDRRVHAEPFRALGDRLREAATPPHLRRAIISALPLVPGASRGPDARDALGRRGVLLSRIIDGQREELVIDPRTLLVLEERYVMVEDRRDGYAIGDLLGRTTYVERAVVARLGERP